MELPGLNLKVDKYMRSLTWYVSRLLYRRSLKWQNNVTADAAVDWAIEGGPGEDHASSDHADSDLYEGSEDEAES